MRQLCCLQFRRQVLLESTEIYEPGGHDGERRFEARACLRSIWTRRAVDLVSLYILALVPPHGIDRGTAELLLEVGWHFFALGLELGHPLRVVISFALQIKAELHLDIIGFVELLRLGTPVVLRAREKVDKRLLARVT